MYFIKGLKTNSKKTFSKGSVQLPSHVWLFATSWTAARQASLSITCSRSYPNSCPLSRGCHPTISSSVVPFFSCPQSFPASRSFPVSQLFSSGGQRIGVSASTSVLPMNWLDLLVVQGTVKSLLWHHSSKASSFVLNQTDLKLSGIKMYNKAWQIFYVNATNRKQYQYQWYLHAVWTVGEAVHDGGTGYVQTTHTFCSILLWI